MQLFPLKFHFYVFCKHIECVIEACSNIKIMLCLFSPQQMKLDPTLPSVPTDPLCSQTPREMLHMETNGKAEFLFICNTTSLSFSLFAKSVDLPLLLWVTTGIGGIHMHGHFVGILC